MSFAQARKRCGKRTVKQVSRAMMHQWMQSRTHWRKGVERLVKGVAWRREVRERSPINTRWIGFASRNGSVSVKSTTFGPREPCIERELETRIRHIRRQWDGVIRRDARGRGSGHDRWICPTQWMPGHLNRETRRLRLSRGGGAWESPSVPRIPSNFSFSVFQRRVPLDAATKVVLRTPRTNWRVPLTLDPEVSFVDTRQRSTSVVTHGTILTVPYHGSINIVYSLRGNVYPDNFIKAARSVLNSTLDNGQFRRTLTGFVVRYERYGPPAEYGCYPRLTAGIFWLKVRARTWTVYSVSRVRIFRDIFVKTFQFFGTSILMGLFFGVLGKIEIIVWKLYRETVNVTV